MGQASHVWGGHSCPPHLTFPGSYRESVQLQSIVACDPCFQPQKQKSKSTDKSVRPTQEAYLLDQRASVCWLFFWRDHYRCGYSVPRFDVQQADALG